MKVNYDFKEKYFASKIMHPPRFVNVEYMHSASLDEVESRLPIAIHSCHDNTELGSIWGTCGNDSSLRR
jgi:hypothetical protein